MPNWCSNTLAIHGKTEDVYKFIEDNKNLEDSDIPLSFERAIPTPDQTKFEGKEYKEVSNEPDYWYNYHVSHWGTKWDVGEDAHAERHDNGDGTSTVVYTFDTAWAPPEAWLAHAATNYNTLSMKLEYREAGMGFAGVLGFHKGQEVENQQWDVQFHTDVVHYGATYE